MDEETDYSHVIRAAIFCNFFGARTGPIMWRDIRELGRPVRGQKSFVIIYSITVE